MSAASLPADSAWFDITEGLAPYERFRFITTHVLRAALLEAVGYAKDRRIFTDVDSVETLRAHLGILDSSLKDDESLTKVQREFLCAAVAAALRELDAEAKCLADLIRGAWRNDGSTTH